MSWSYTSANLNTTNAIGRLNSVRFLVGDTDQSDPQVQDEEIFFALAQTSDDIYTAGSYIAKSLAAKYSRLVDIELDGELSESYSQLRENYEALAEKINALKIAAGNVSIGIAGGGLPAAGKTNREFWVNQFDFFAQDVDRNSDYC